MKAVYIVLPGCATVQLREFQVPYDTLVKLLTFKYILFNIEPVILYTWLPVYSRVTVLETLNYKSKK